MESPSNFVMVTVHILSPLCLDLSQGQGSRVPQGFPLLFLGTSCPPLLGAASTPTHKPVHSCSLERNGSLPTVVSSFILTVSKPPVIPYAVGSPQDSG